MLWLDEHGLVHTGEATRGGPLRAAVGTHRADLERAGAFSLGNEGVGWLPLSPEAFSHERDWRAEFSR
jgi:hypothetical protein